jgi:flagellar motor switch/type III secretory pathway protein FliN
VGEALNAAPRVRAFPWGALDTTTRAEASAVRDVRRWAATHTDLARLPAFLADLLGVGVDLRIRRVRPVDQPRGIEGGAAVVLANADSPGLARAVVIEAEQALVATVVARITRRPPPVVLQAGETASAGLSGAFAAFVAAALRRAHGQVTTRVLAAGPAPALEADLARAGHELVAIALTVLVGDDAFDARIVAPRGGLLGLPLLPWDVTAVAALGITPLALPVVAHAVRLPATELARLAPGDALMLPGWPLARPAPGGLAGRVLLSAPCSEVGIEAWLGEDGHLVLRGDPVPLCAADETERGDGMNRSELVEAIGDVPVVVRVEIGEAQMTAREWATIGRGDVVALGRRIGEPVVLRVGGVPVARGDLVEIDGEVGVRVVERLGTPGALR